MKDLKKKKITQSEIYMTTWNKRKEDYYSKCLLLISNSPNIRPHFERTNYWNINFTLIINK